MLLWINGAFGSGKSSVANELCKRLKKAYVYDPEMAGYFLWEVFPDEMKRKGNFQHIPAWREINYKTLTHIHENYDGIIVAPMTVYIKQYYDEIPGRFIDEGISVRHFILSASKQTILDRLVGRGEAEDGWAARHIDRCISAFDGEITGEKIITDGKSIEEVASEILESVN